MWGNYTQTDRQTGFAPIMFAMVHISFGFAMKCNEVSKSKDAQPNILELCLLFEVCLPSLQLDHPSIVKFHDSFMDGDFFCIITEYCEVSLAQYRLGCNHACKTFSW